MKQVRRRYFYIKKRVGKVTTKWVGGVVTEQGKIRSGVTSFPMKCE